MNEAAGVIITYNSEAVIGPCLDAAIPRLGEIVVIDNASEDGTRIEVLKRPGVRWVQNGVNRGFAASANQGISSVNAPYLLLLNPDTVLLTGVEPLLASCRDPGVGAAAGKLVDATGRPQVGFSVRRFPTAPALAAEALGVNRLWPGNPVNRRFRCLDLDYEAPADVEQPAGAFLLVRRDAWWAIGGFDEQFHPLWFEDVDFLKRLREHGYRVRYVPYAAARHAGGHSVRKVPRERRDVYWYASLLRYSTKHFRSGQRRAVCLAVAAGAVARSLGSVLLSADMRLLRAYGKVIRLACLGLFSSQLGGNGSGPLLARR